MTILHRPNAWLLAWLTCAGLLACGGGGGGTVNSSDWTSNPAGAATFSGTAAAYQGTISGLGSIVVNGVRFETTDANVYDPDDFDDNTRFASPLALGMTVALAGDVDDTQNLGSAQHIRVVGGVRGTISSLSSTAIGLPTQTVTLNANTAFSGTDGATSVSNYSDLNTLFLANGVGNVWVSIYGLPQSDNSFLATRVVLTQSNAHAYDVALRGKITAINGNNYTVSTGLNTAVSVACSNCTIRPLGAQPEVGAWVRVLASDNTQWNAAASTLNGTRLQLLDAKRLATFTGVSTGYNKIKGVASNSNGVWTIGGVEVSGTTGLVNGSFYEAKGTWSGNALVVSKLETENERQHVDNSGNRHSYQNELYGAVSNLSGNIFSVQGVSVDASNAYFPVAAALANGSFVEVKGNYNAGVLIATKVDIKSSVGSSANSIAGVGRVFEMYGQISNWQGLNSSFTITRAGTAYTAQTVASVRLKNGTPSNASFVEAKGYMDANSVFQVIKLEVKNFDHEHDD